PAVAVSEPKPHWLMDLLASPLNLAMIILLPVLLVLALVTLWLRARARRELEEQEKSLSESTAMMMDQEQSEFDNLLKVEVTDNEPVRPVAAVDPATAESPQPEADLVLRDEHNTLSQERSSQPLAAQPVSADPDLVPDLDRWLDQPITLANQPDMDLAGEFNPKAGKEIMSEEALQAALFAELDVDIEPELSPQAKDAVNRVVDVASFDLSDFESAFEQQMPAKAIDLSRPDSTDEMLAELAFEPAGATSSDKQAKPDLAWDPNELALADFEDAFNEVNSAEGTVQSRKQANEGGYVEIDKLLADADATAPEQEPYQGFSLDVGLDGFPEVLPESTGFDVDADDG
ncbi:MAG: FimV/HubP family polar landmark protein, partial [Aeromonas sp.]